MSEKSKLSTDSYKGVRDFYPEDMFIQNYIFMIWRRTLQSFGYVEYSASILEPAELYRAKSGEEIVNEQTYTFTDRGDREVTLRPEMTPTVARMVASRERDLTFPLRWFSMPNLFRYEKPQRGRLREHWQLNADLFGVESNDADVEIISIASSLMKMFGARESDFVIRINSRKIINDLFAHFSLTDDELKKVTKLIDKKDKISEDAFADGIQNVIGSKSSDFIRTLSSNERVLDTLGPDNKNSKNLIDVLEKLTKLGIGNAVFDPTIMRGFDYYTGIVFEVHDTHPDNNRSVFGGGRYDDLLDIFGARKIPTVGFGAGDVTARDFMETHKLLPEYRSSTEIHICILGPEFIDNANLLATQLRSVFLNVSVDLSGKKIGDQLKIAHKQSIPFVICIGENEATTGVYPLKNMTTGEEVKVKAEEILGIIRK
ncbi:MAG: histidine--tRNA ligase [Patescibacteria group bacterium]